MAGKQRVEQAVVSVKRGVAQAESICKQNHARLTPLRRRVLELVLISRKPVGAYKLLEDLKHDDFSDAPPTVYRALEFLLTHGLVHRIAKSNTYVACTHPHDDHHGLMFVCRECGEAIESEEHRLLQDIGRCGDEHGFRIPNQIVEIEGICSACRMN